MTQTFSGRKWLGLGALMPAIAMVFTDQSVLPVALPTIQKQLGATQSELWWSINSYLLVSAVFMLAGGKLGDRIGHRKTFMGGMLLFALASVLCGLSFQIHWFIGARALQGIGAALMIPASAPLIMSLFPQKERGKAIGLNVSVSSLFLIFAPLIGGYFTEVLSWRWIFWINLPLAFIGLLLVPFFVPSLQGKKQVFDFKGFYFFTISSSCLVSLIMQAGEWGLFSFSNGCLFAFFLISTFFLWRREKNSKHPFIELSLFRHPIYKAVNISVFSTQFVLMISIYRALFFQEVMDWSPLKSGVIFSITSTPVLFMSPMGGWIADRFGAKIPITIGFILLIGSFFWTAFFVQGSLGLLLLGFFAFGIGVPLIFTPSYSSAMGSVASTKAGVAFGVLATVRALAATLGVAVISSFAHHVEKWFLQSLKNTNPIEKMVDPSLLLQYVKQSQIQGFFVVHLAMGFALLIAFVFVFILYHRKALHHMPETPAEGWD